MKHTPMDGQGQSRLLRPRSGWRSKKCRDCGPRHGHRAQNSSLSQGEGVGRSLQTGTPLHLPNPAQREQSRVEGPPWPWGFRPPTERPPQAMSDSRRGLGMGGTASRAKIQMFAREMVGILGWLSRNKLPPLLPRQKDKSETQTKPRMNLGSEGITQFIAGCFVCEMFVSVKKRQVLPL